MLLGYQHSAFSFGIESHITQSNINNTVVPPGALVNLLQKGIQFIEGELCVTDVSCEHFCDTCKRLSCLKFILKIKCYCKQLLSSTG